MLNKVKKKLKRRYNDIKMRVDGTYWKKIKEVENALDLYAQTASENPQQKKWLIKYFEKKICREKAFFFFSKTITRKLFPDPHLQICSEDSGSLSEQKDRLIFKEIQIPLPINKNDESILNGEFLDIIAPYLFNDIRITMPIIFYLNSEGSYEIDENVCLEKNDIVIDCGANMGLFSAVASAKKCIVYAFEPFPYVIEKYLSKTANWNKNINICQYALWDKEATLSIEVDEGNIGGTSAVMSRKSGKKIEVKAIKLDEFVQKNNIPRIDFIKADIEGAERNMLLGARNVIREFSPKISVCTYHLPDDPKILREILLDIQPKYKIQEKFKKMYAYVP